MFTLTSPSSSSSVSPNKFFFPAAAAAASTTLATAAVSTATKPLHFSRFEPVQKALHLFFLTVIDEYVTKLWYSSISTNKDFQYQLLFLIAQISYGLEERLIKVDWNQVFFSDVPYLLKQHYTAYEFSKTSILPHLYQSSCPISLDLIYHSLIPHVAMVDPSSEQEYLRCFVDHVLKQLGPTYLAEADLERVLYREILTHVLEFLWNTVSEPDFIVPWITYLITPSRVPSRREQLPWWKQFQQPVYQLWHHVLIISTTISLLLRRKPSRTDLDLPILTVLDPILPNSKLLHFFVHVWTAWARVPIRWLLGPLLDAYIEASLHQWLSMYTISHWIDSFHLFLSEKHHTKTNVVSTSTSSSSSSSVDMITIGPLNEQIKLPVMDNKYRNKHVLFLFLDAFIWHVFPEFLNRLTMDWVPKKKPSHNVTKTTVTGITAKQVTLHRKTKSSSSIQTSYRI